MKTLPASSEALEAKALRPGIADTEEIGFPRVYAAIKWAIVITLVFLSLAAAAFWVVILGDFAGSGFRPIKPYGESKESMMITPECAWPYRVDHHDAKAVCRMFHHLTPEQREEVLGKRKRQAP